MNNASCTKAMLTTVLLYRSKFNGIPSVFACPCCTLSRTLDWCCRSLRTIFVYENSEIMRQSAKKIVIIIVSVFTLKFQTNTVDKVVKQPQARTARTRFSVTTCLYLNPNNRARSLSTLRAVDAKTDTPQKATDKDENRWENMIFKILMSILSTRSIRVAMSGWEMRPTPRSVMAKHWNNSFVGGWIEVTLRRVIRIRMLPRDAVMEKTIFTAAIAMYKPTRMFAESSVSITVTFPPSVKITIFLAVETRCLTLTASQKVFFSAMTHKVFMMYKLRLFI